MAYKKVLYRGDIPVADYLMSLADGLRKDFLGFHTDFIDGAFAKGEPPGPIYSVDRFLNRSGAWLGTGVKYQFGPKADFMPEDWKQHFPTAVNLTNEFWDDCPISSYSIMEPKAIIGRHTGPENRDGEYIRIHIPLIVPEGDVFFEVGGEVVYWDDIFGFDNQTIHSAYNFTDKRRLVYLIDIRRSRIGLPKGRTFNKERDEDAYPPFNPDNYRKHK